MLLWRAYRGPVQKHGLWYVLEYVSSLLKNPVYRINYLPYWR